MDIYELKDLGLLIRDRRVRLGWPQRQLAMRAGVGRQWVVDLEKGKAAAPLHLLIRTLNVLGLVLRVLDDLPTRLAVMRHSNGEPRPPGPRNGLVAPLPDGASPGVPDRSAAAGQDEPQHRTSDGGPAYQPTNFASLGIAVSKDSLYAPEYRSVIQRMADHVIRSEGPAFEDLVARRIARAHDLARISEKLLQIIREVTDPSFARTSEGQRSIVWPSAEPLNLVPFRASPKEVRDHQDVPLPELASLAGSFLAKGRTPSEAVELMGRRIGLKRIAQKTRARFEAAVEHARKCA